MGLLAEEREVSRAAEDKLTYKLGLAAEVKCADLIAAYNACARGRTVSVAWRCRAAYKASNACIATYVNQANIDAMKQRWLDAGRPTQPDWNGLLDGIVALEHRQPHHQAAARQAAAAAAKQAAKASSSWWPWAR